jgi:O-6-methylguanine DNA methyltransferase
MPKDRTRFAQPDQTPSFAVWNGCKELGSLWIAWSERGLVSLRFGTPDPRFPEAMEAELPAHVSDLLSRYVDGQPVDPIELPIDLPGASKFQDRVWQALRAVKRGHVRSYAGLAADAGSPRAMRAVGMAMGHNPIAIVIPCHRCVAQGHAIGGFTGGLPRKRFLLELEGVRVQGDRVLPGQLDLL